MGNGKLIFAWPQYTFILEDKSRITYHFGREVEKPEIKLQIEDCEGIVDITLTMGECREAIKALEFMIIQCEKYQKEVSEPDFNKK